MIFSPGWFMPASDSPSNTEGLTTIPSRFGPKETMDRLATEIQAKGMKVPESITREVRQKQD